MLERARDGGELERRECMASNVPVFFLRRRRIGTHAFAMSLFSWKVALGNLQATSAILQHPATSEWGSLRRERETPGRTELQRYGAPTFVVP